MVPVGGASVVTVRVAAALVALPAALVTTTRNCAPLSANVGAGRVYVSAVAPAMSAPLRCHWYVNGWSPVAVAANVAGSPGMTVVSIGSEAIAGLPENVTLWTMPGLFVASRRDR